MTSVLALLLVLFALIFNSSMDSSMVEQRQGAQDAGSIPAPSTTLTGEGQFVVAIEKYFPSEAQVDALCVAKKESGLNPLAVGVLDERGLMQVYPPAHPEFDQERLFEVEYNIQAAAEIWRASGETFQKDWVRASWLCGAR